MKHVTRITTMTAAVLIVAATAYAQAAQTAKPQTAPPAQQAAADPQKPPTYEETVVVSASKTEQKVVDAPATMTVFTPKFLQNTPAANYGDLLRTVPGVNVTQLSARDINVTSRGATSSLSTTQLAVIDGRSIYQDFFGFVMWDFMPANMNEVKQIEVIRGPASAVWGANAMNGVINVITKSPREMRGGSVNMGFGMFDRNVNNNVTNAEVKQDAGSQFYVNGTFADVINDQWSYKATAGYSMSDALARPAGNLPNNSGTPYPTFTNDGTKQPKFDLRLDRDAKDGSKITLSGGVSGTTGIMESGIGPFQIQSGTTMSYGKAAYAKGSFHAAAFLNTLNGEAPNLLSVDPTNKPVQLNFDTKTFDIEVGNSTVVSKNVFTYGGNLRFNKFDLTLAPGETSRTEGGGYVQDELFINKYARLVGGVRIDKFSSIDKAVFSPRVALVLKPQPDKTFRVSYNRAFRAPSMINNNLDVTIGTPLPLAALNPTIKAATGGLVPALFGATRTFFVPTRATGNPDLTEEHIDAFEVSFTGKVGPKNLFSAAYFYNKISNEIFFTVKSLYDVKGPPAGFTTQPEFLGLAAQIGQNIGGSVWAGVQNSAHFPSEYTYLNLGKVNQQGIELGWDTEVNAHASFYANYSYQKQPEPSFPGLTAEQALAEINIPAKNRFNAGVTASQKNVFGTIDMSYVDKAFWQDVLDSRYSGYTADYTVFNAVAGVRLNHDKATVQFRVNNLANKAIQQHIFGDVQKRSFMVELKINVPKK